MRKRSLKQVDNLDYMYYIDEYTPWSMSNTHSDFDKMIMDMKNYETEPEWKVRKQKEAKEFFFSFLKATLNNINSAVMICRIPRSTKNLENHVCTVGEKLSRSLGLEDGTNVLTRHTSIEPSHNGGTRNKQRQYDSIDVIGNIMGKSIILLDDVITSGASMDACREMLLDAGANDVICIGLGKTIE